MKKKFLLFIALILGLLCIAPINSFALEYNESIKKIWSNNNAVTLGLNSLEVNDGVVVLDIRQNRMINSNADFNMINTLIKYDNNGTEIWRYEMKNSPLYGAYGLMSDGQYIYVISFDGLKKISNDGKLVEEKANVRGYNIKEFGNYYVVIDANYKANGDDIDATKENPFTVFFYDKDFNLVSSMEDVNLYNVYPELLVDDNKLYYLILSPEGEGTKLVTIDDSLKRTEQILTIPMSSQESVPILGFSENDESFMMGQLFMQMVKIGDTFYISSPLGIYKIDSNYTVSFVTENLYDIVTKISEVQNSGVDLSLVPDLKYFAPLGIIYKNNKFIVSGVNISAKAAILNESSLLNVKEYAAVRIYDSNFNYESEINLNGYFGFRSETLNTSVTLPFRLVSFSDGFGVCGFNVNNGMDFFMNVDMEEFDYPLTLPDASAFMIKLSIGKKIETKIVGNGRIVPSKSYGTASDKITYTIDPEEGYTLVKLRVVTKSGIEVKVVNGTFEMPDEEVIIEAKFVPTSSIQNPQTSATIFVFILLISLVGISSFLVYKQISSAKKKS